MSETLTQRNERKSYAESIARYADVDLLPGQVELYELLRDMKREPIHDVDIKDHRIWSLSDQQILYLVLEPDQQTKFEERYGHIDFTEALECFGIWCDYERPDIEHIPIADDMPIPELLTA